MHIRIADQAAEGPKQRGIGDGLRLDMGVGGEAACDGGPAARSRADKFGVKRGEREERSAAQFTRAIKTFDLKEALSTEGTC